MPTIRLHPNFPKKLQAFVKYDGRKKKAVQKTLRLFQKDSGHQSLRVEKLRGSDTWTIRVDKGNRLFFVWSDEGDTAIFFAVGPHDMYRKVK